METVTDFYMTDEPLLDFSGFQGGKVEAAAGAVLTPDASAAVFLAKYISDRRSEAWRSWRRSEASRAFLRRHAVIR